MKKRLAEWQRVTTGGINAWVFAGYPYQYDIYPESIPIANTFTAFGLPGMNTRTEHDIYRLRNYKVFPARSDGYCPYCSTFIRAGRSQIVRLPQPATPIAYQLPKQNCLSAITGRAFNSKGRPIAMHGRNYAHFDCVKNMMRMFWHPYCTYCGSPDDLSIDHIHPQSQEGPDEPGNITVACGKCNSRKGTMNVNDFLAKLNA